MAADTSIKHSYVMDNNVSYNNIRYNSDNGNFSQITILQHENAGNRYLDPTKDQNSNKPADGEIDRYLWMYCSPFIFLVGVIGNIFIIIVLSRVSQHLKRSNPHGNKATAPLYLTLMATADIGFLIFGIIPEWLEACQFLLLDELHPVSCKIEKFMFYVTGDIAIWTITAFTFDRFIAVCFPFKKKFICVPKYARIISCCIMIAAVSKNLHVFWTRGSEHTDFYDVIIAPHNISDNVTVVQRRNLTTNCGRPEPFDNFEYYIRPWLAFALISLLPFTVILICNIFIIKSLITARKNMKSSSNSANCDKGFMQTIFMCLSASFAFLLCVTPSMVIYIGKPYWTDEENPNYSYDIAKAVNNQLAYVNHSINFFLYCITGRKFREEFLAIFTSCCCCDNKSARQQTTILSQTTYDNRKYSKTNEMDNRNGDNKNARTVSISMSAIKNSAFKTGYKSVNNNSPASERYISRLHSNSGSSPLCGRKKLIKDIAENGDCVSDSDQSLSE